MGRRRRDRNNSSQKNNSISYTVGNEENVHPDPNLRKTMINVTSSLQQCPQKSLKEEIWK
jgi:hypothetical protein